MKKTVARIIGDIARGVELNIEGVAIVSAEAEGRQGIIKLANGVEIVTSVNKQLSVTLK